MSTNKIYVSICVLSYNGREVLERCLRSINQDSPHISKEVIVIDNGSTDSTAEMVNTRFPEVKLIVNKRNENFTKSYNRMVKEAQGRYLLILSNDVELVNDSLEKLFAFMETHPEVGAVVPLSRYRDGPLEPVCWREVIFWRLMLQWTFLGRLLKWQREAWSQHQYYDLQVPQPVDVARDFCLLLRREVVNQVGLYDENFKLYYTEDDLCKRIRQQGWQIFYYPEAKVQHLLSYTTRSFNPIYVKWLYVTDMLYYSRKYFGSWRTNAILRPLVYLTLALRLPGWIWERVTKKR